ncbi:sacsin-like [Genypterus blacodes]|uniref:sacsin-like n=1 Tax=Genypterus blacodes TaxID=154954 RepID=UPI003F76611F
MSSRKQRKARTSFGATAPPFIDYLKDILRRYPDGGQILKELVQNADDAQATEVVFIHDERNYGTESLCTEGLGKYQGPALYVYNNADFSDEDWEGIQAAGRSVKRNDPNKVGRFGLGFNSVYHITDVPSIFSSGHLGLLDPQEKLFGKGNGGSRWSLADTEDQEMLMTLHDQFQPFRDILSLVNKPQWSKIIMEDKHFDGTIFRFPLRNETSDISDKLYDSDKVVELFDSFIADAHLSLLFLRHVTSVSLIHINKDSSVNTRLKVTSSTNTDVILEPEEESVVKGSTSFKSITLSSEDPTETKWLVTTCCMKEGNIEQLDSLSEKLSFLPQVDLAFPCGQTIDCNDSRLSCFLPLPNLSDESNKTGLPVYINACFGLTDNRRHIKWQEEDQKHDEAALWNELLLKEVLPHAYLMILQDAIKLSQASMLPVSTVYDIWPDVTQTQQKEKWHTVALDVLHQLFRENVAVLSLAKDETMFVTPSEAVLPCNGPTPLATLEAIERTLVSCGANLVTLPASVAKAIEAAYPDHNNLTRVTPSFLRDVLHRTGVRNICKEDKLCLLEFILIDGKYADLRGLQLLPRSDGTFRSFTDEEEDTVLIDNDTFPRFLLPGLGQHLFIPDDLSTTCSDHLIKLAATNLFKVFNLDKDKVVDFVRSCLPEDWSQTTTGNVTWKIGSSHHPPSDWLQRFWNFLNAHFKELSRFTGMPLIPVTPIDKVRQPVSLARLQKNTTLIFQNTRQVSLPDHIAELVNKVGGTVVRGNEWLKHADLDSYVLCPSPSSVMKVFVNLDAQHVIRQIQTVSQVEREIVKDYLSSLGSLPRSEKDLLSKLPLFQTMNGLSVGAQSKQAVLLNSGLKVPEDLPMPDSVVQCATEADRRLLQLLNIKLMDTAQAANLLIDCVERAACKKEDTEKIMTWILQHGNILFSQNKTLKSRCKDLSFIEVNGELKKTAGFFDPQNETFTALFESELFPPCVYTQTQQMLESLTDIGLLNKETQVAPSHVLQVATQINKLHVGSPIEMGKRAQALLRMLDGNDLLSRFSQPQLDSLKMLKWVPCAQPTNEREQPQKQSQKSWFFCPDEVRLSQYKDMVGYVMPLIGKLNNRVNNQLGLNRTPPPQKVLDNLGVLKSKAQTMDDPDTDADFKRRLHSIYKHMQDHNSEFTTIMSKDTCWLWNRNQFVATQDLVLNYPPNLDLSSYIGKVPYEFLPFKMLLMKLGLRESLSEEEIVAILHSIKQAIDRRQQPFARSSELKVSIEIVSWLWREKKSVPENIPVPVITDGGQFTLKPLSMTVFCDINKHGLKELQNGQEEIHVIHEEIPKAAAEWLNIPFLSTRILSPEFVGIEQCGQSEPITIRLKNILKEYDEDSDIFKELIQNSEDAGANACKFLVDFREHQFPPDSLIDPEMTLCQGPCLWAYNNEQFTPEDWENIVRVGAASKENKVEKIGKFGLGFNTVYHITDIPSILSGKSLLILDPNVTHLRTHIKNKTNPGIKLDLSLKRHFDFFPGQFRPYENIFDCSFTRQSPPKPYPGTLIKLPFRTPEEALKSDISKNVYDKHHIKMFQHHLTNDSQTHLLFLKNISTLSLQSISNDASTPPRDDQIKTVMTVSKTIVSTMMLPDPTCISQQRQAEKWLIELDEKCKEVIDCCAASIVTIASQQHMQSEVQSWLLYNCFGKDHALKMAQKKQTRFSLPIGGIAVPLQNDRETGKFSVLQTEHTGQAFCFLPLSIDTGLPVNVNGTFAVTSNRKGLWESGVKHEWNVSLLQDPVTTAYVTVLSVLKDMCENKQLESYCYHAFWPDREKVSHTFKPLVDAFYSAVAQSIGPELFSDGKHWCSMNNAIFLHQSIEEDKSIAALAMQVCQKHTRAPNQVVSLPLWLRNSFKQAGLGEMLQRRTWDWEKFYKEVVFSNLDVMDPKSRNILVLNAIDLNITEIDDLLVRYPCIPTTGGQLQYIGKLVNPSGKVACLFEQEEGRLLDSTKSDFCFPKRIQRLLELGMLNDDLPWEDITEKASTVRKTWYTDTKKAYGHLRCLLELMKMHMQEESPCWETLRNTEFLPAFSPGDIKMSGEVKLRRPTDVFNEKCHQLVNMTHPVLDHSNLKMHSTDPVLQFLGVRESPEPKTVLQQLHEAWKKSQNFDKDMLQRMAHECYKFLDQWLCSSEDHMLISETANSFPFILLGNDFVHVNTVAENDQLEAKPYLHVLPAALACFRTLWECVGVQRIFTVNQFHSVLQKLKCHHGNNSLPKTDLNVCLTILTKGICETEAKTKGDCLVPDEHGVLQLASKIYYNDSPWMPVTKGLTLCHNKIARDNALILGIETTRHQTLQNVVIENLSPFAFEFEQREELPVRIKNIISAYPSKKDILKELIQNADDAEATEIHFVWDKRQHGTEKTFGDRWNKLQGPALCVYNNKVFSDSDLKGIQQLGEGGKRCTPEKTGKYGVGFNSVYHLTDCPSILTGDELLCISDPNQEYIECHPDKPQAGIGYKLGGVFNEMYNDVYKSFLPDEFPLEQGTMFRLPLRIGTMANSSKISQQAVTDRDMMELRSALSEDPEGLILFLKNIRKMTFHEISENPGELKTIFEVEKSLPKANNEKKAAFQKHVQEALQSDKAITPQKAFYQVDITTSARMKNKWLIAEQLGSFKDSSGNEKNQSDKLPQAAVAARVQCKPLPPEEFSGEAFCSLPLPGQTGLPVHVNGNFEVDSSRRSLWKEDGQSLKMKWNESLKQNVIAPLYADLLRYISSNFQKIKGDQKGMAIRLKDIYLRFFPVVSKDVAQDWQEMIHDVYRSIHERALCVIPVLRRSERIIAQRSITENSYVWCSVRETESTNAPHLTDEYAQTINPILEDVGMKLVPCSAKMKKVWNSFKSAGIEVKYVSPAAVRNFLKERPLHDSTQNNMNLPQPISATPIGDKSRCSQLLIFCLKDLCLENATTDISGSIHGLPLLLTRDQVLRVFDCKSPKLISRYDSLFSGYEEEFADYSTNADHMQVLQAGNLVNTLTVPSAVKYLKPLLQQLLQGCEVDKLTGLHVPNDKIQKWLQGLWRFLTSNVKPATSTNTGDDTSLTLSKVRELFEDCCMLPVVCPRLNNQHFLQKMKDMPRVIQCALDEDMSKILFKLGFMRLDSTFFLEMGFTVFSLLSPELMKVTSKSSILDKVCEINRSEFSQLTMEDMKELQCFLQNGLSRENQEYHRKLKSLPIFQTIHGERVRIDGPEAVFILNVSKLKSFPDLLMLPNNGSIFLKNNNENMSESKTLNIQVLDDLEYFLKFLLPILHKLTDTQLLHCIKLVLSLRYHDEYCESEEKIISSMKTVNLIRSSQGTMERASYFYDEDVELYKAMLPEEKFVPQNFWSEVCKTDTLQMACSKALLKQLGMKHDVSKDEIINFAFQIESEAKGHQKLEELKKKSPILLRAATTMACDEKGEQRLLESIANIKFIFPVKIQQELRSYHKPSADESTAVAIRGSLIHRNPESEELIWTSMPIIDLKCYKSAKLLQKVKAAGAFEHPPSQSVTSNMSNICESPCASAKLLNTRAKVFRSCYGYLQNNNFESRQLIGLPIVLVEKNRKLVRTDEVCLSLEHCQDLRPYLYKTQEDDLIFADFFKKIGIKSEATAVQYCNVLAAVHADSCDKKRPIANQQITARRAVAQLFHLIKSEGNQSPVELVEILYLPSVDGRLYPSSSLYYNDTVYTKRLEEGLQNKVLLLEKLRKCHLGSDCYEHQRMLELLPLKIQPKMLSQFTKEKVVESGMEPCEYVTGCAFSRRFEEHLSSAAFRHGLICLIRGQSEGKITQEEAVDMWKKTFGSIQIVCCKSLETQLWLGGESLHRTTAETDVYVKQSQQGCIFYLKHSEDMALKVINKINMTLTKEMNALLGNRMGSKYLTVLGVLLTCDSLEDVQETLAENGIHDSVEEKSCSHNLPAPGTPIPEEWHDSLDMDVLNNFEEGEYVGYSLDNTYIYAVIVEQLPGAFGMFEAKYKIQIGQDEIIEVTSLDLFQFKRAAKPRQATSTALQVVEGAVPNSSQTSSSTRFSSTSLEEAKREIDKTLAEIWSSGLSKEMREKAIKRLYLKWHPDKNPDRISLATEAFKYLMQRIEELTTGKTNKSSNSRGNSHFRDFYQQWNQEAGHHRSGRERFYTGSHSRSYNFWDHFQNVPKPDTEEARRWCRQARCDLKAASNDTGGGSTEWCLFKVHQAVEKSLIAAEYKRNGKHPTSTSISSAASVVSNYNSQLRDLPEIVSILKQLGVDAKKTQYPNCHTFPHIPNGQFRSENEKKAMDKASELLTRVEAYVN